MIRDGFKDSIFGRSGAVILDEEPQLFHVLLNVDKRAFIFEGEGRIYSNLTGRHPCILHYNGRSYVEAFAVLKDQGWPPVG